MHLAVMCFSILVGLVCLFFYGIIIAIYQNTSPCCIVIYPYVSLVYKVLFFGFKFKILHDQTTKE